MQSVAFVCHTVQTADIGWQRAGWPGGGGREIMNQGTQTPGL